MNKECNYQVANGRINGATPGSLHADERGRISVLLVLCVIPFVFLIAFIFNTATQTGRKIEMQGAADSAAIAGGTYQARGMNAMALNNNLMAGTLAAMIVLRSTLQTAEVESKLLALEAASHLASVVGAITGIKLLAEAYRFATLARTLKPFDRRISNKSSGAWWLIMRGLDYANVGIKVATPALATAKTIEFAKRNGADRAPYGLMVPGSGAAMELVPALPVGRGMKEELVDRAEEHHLKHLEMEAGISLSLFAPVAFISSFPNQLIVFKGMIAYNKSNLRGSRTAGALSHVMRFVATEALAWPSQPPRPMLLTDEPSSNPRATFDVKESRADLAKVRKYLQYLAVAFGRMERESRIGGGSFLNAAPYQSLAYGEADVYNPTRWRMFEMDWRVKLAPALVLNDRIGQIAGKIGIPGASQFTEGIRLVNKH
jgi:hypothetical protein